jgi:hypothetical protein
MGRSKKDTVFLKVPKRMFKIDRLFGITNKKVVSFLSEHLKVDENQIESSDLKSLIVQLKEVIKKMDL